MGEKSKILKIILIISVSILIINDHYLKIIYHNYITGKLSDVFGLLAISILICTKAEKYRKYGLLLLGLLFVFWKSPYSSSIIEFANNYSFPVGRTIDYSDLLVLPIIVLPIFLNNRSRLDKIRIVLSPWIYILCLFAFIATTLPPREKRSYLGVNKNYVIDLPIESVVSRINAYQNEALKRYDNHVDFDSETESYYHRTTKEKVAQLIDVDKINRKDTLSISNAFADIMIFSRKENETEIKLINVYKIAPIANNKDYENKAIREFEKRIIDPLLKDSKNYLAYRFEGPVSSIQEILSSMKRKFDVDSNSVCDYVFYNSEIISIDSNLIVSYNHVWPIQISNANNKNCSFTFEINSIINQSNKLKEDKLKEVENFLLNEGLSSTHQISNSELKAIVINGIQLNPHESKSKILSLSVSEIKSIFITNLPANREIYGELGKNGLVEIQLYRNKI